MYYFVNGHNLMFMTPKRLWPGIFFGMLTSSLIDFFYRMMELTKLDKVEVWNFAKVSLDLKISVTLKWSWKKSWEFVAFVGMEKVFTDYPSWMHWRGLRERRFVICLAEEFLDLRVRPWGQPERILSARFCLVCLFRKPGTCSRWGSPPRRPRPECTFWRSPSPWSPTGYWCAPGRTVPREPGQIPQPPLPPPPHQPVLELRRCRGRGAAIRTPV